MDPQPYFKKELREKELKDNLYHRICAYYLSEFLSPVLGSRRMVFQSRGHVISKPERKVVRLYDHLSYQDCYGILSHPQVIPASGGGL